MVLNIIKTFTSTLTSASDENLPSEILAYNRSSRTIFDKILLSAAGTNNRAAVINRDASGFLRTNLTLDAVGTSSDILVLTATKVNSGDTPKVTASVSWGEVK